MHRYVDQTWNSWIMWYLAFGCANRIEEVSQDLNNTHEICLCLGKYQRRLQAIHTQCPITYHPSAQRPWVTEWPQLGSAHSHSSCSHCDKNKEWKREEETLGSGSLEFRFERKNKRPWRPTQRRSSLSEYVPCRKSLNPLKYTHQPAQKTKQPQNDQILNNNTSFCLHLHLPSLLSCNWLFFTLTRWQLCH